MYVCIYMYIVFYSLNKYVKMELVIPSQISFSRLLFHMCIFITGCCRCLLVFLLTSRDDWNFGRRNKRSHGISIAARRRLKGGLSCHSFNRGFFGIGLLSFDHFIRNGLRYQSCLVSVWRTRSTFMCDSLTGQKLQLCLLSNRIGKIIICEFLSFICSC